MLPVFIGRAKASDDESLFASVGRGPSRRRLTSDSVVKVRGARGGSAPLLRIWRSLAPLLESEPSLPTAAPKLLNSIKNHNVRCRINKF